jgi:hypothetical protein
MFVPIAGLFRREFRPTQFVTLSPSIYRKAVRSPLEGSKPNRTRLGLSVYGLDSRTKQSRVGNVAREALAFKVETTYASSSTEQDRAPRRLNVD